MTIKNGDFIWYELLTSDADGACEFYGKLLGWDIEDSGMEGMDYRIISKSGIPVAGLMPIDNTMAEHGARPFWGGYISVHNAKQVVSDLQGKGGKILTPLQHLPDVGHFALIADPQGAMFYLMQPEGEEDSQSFARFEPMEGHCAWNELITGDQAGALDFYQTVFGWENGEAMDMGDLGQYQMLGVNGYTLGAIMNQPPEMPLSLWCYYFRVANIPAATQYVRDNGGQIINGPMQIPGGDFIIQGLDPQGAMFSLIGKGTE
ncbi:MAG: VOC family protein [Sphingomonadaceae bacterium]